MIKHCVTLNEILQNGSFLLNLLFLQEILQSYPFLMSRNFETHGCHFANGTESNGLIYFYKGNSGTRFGASLY